MSCVGVSSSRKVTRDREQFPSLDYQNRKATLENKVILKAKYSISSDLFSSNP